MRASRLIAAAMALWCALGLAAPAFAARVALVVGEAAYAHAPALSTTGADAADVAAALTEVGFATTLRTDADKRQLDEALQLFARDAKGAEAAILYYAGHALAREGRNYLVPVDAASPDLAGLIAIDDAKAALSGAKGLKILVLDAGRGDPFAAAAKEGEAPAAPGLARDAAAAGMIVAYAAKAGETTPEGQGRNSPFAAALVKALKTPGLETGALFRQVVADVAAATDGAQAPEVAMSATPEFYLNPSETDASLWSRIRNGRDITALEEFIARFPRSAYVPDAIARIELVESRKHTPAETGEQADKAQPVAAAPPAPQAAPPPPDLTPAIRDQLRRLGCYAGADADWSSPATQGALTRYAQRSGRSVSAPDAALLDAMKAARPGLCPVCSPRAAWVAGRCVRKTCRPGFYLSSAGACLRAAPPPPRRNPVARPKPKRTAAAPETYWPPFTPSFPQTGRGR